MNDNTQFLGASVSNTIGLSLISWIRTVYPYIALNLDLGVQIQEITCALYGQLSLKIQHSDALTLSIVDFLIAVLGTPLSSDSRRFFQCDK